MFHLGKRPWGPLAGLLAALMSVAVVLAIPGSAGAASRVTASTGHSAAPAASALNPDQVAMTSRVVGTTTNGQRVRGTYTPTRFRVTKAGDLVARGTLRLVIRGADGAVRGTFHRVQMPVSTINGQSVATSPSASRSEAAPSAAPAAAGSCPVLNLVLGPLDLNLLGLVVHLNRVVLNIVAQSGAGNLLGNLLCAVAGLLDGTSLGSLLGQISDLLNSILAILRM